MTRWKKRFWFSELFTIFSSIFMEFFSYPSQRIGFLGETEKVEHLTKSLIFFPIVIKINSAISNFANFFIKRTQTCSSFSYVVNRKSITLPNCAIKKFICITFTNFFGNYFLDKVVYMLKLLSKRKGVKGMLVVMQARKLHPHLRPSLRYPRLEQMLGSPREVILMNLMIQYDDPGNLI